MSWESKPKSRGDQKSQIWEEDTGPRNAVDGQAAETSGDTVWLEVEEVEKTGPNKGRSWAELLYSYKFNSKLKYDFIGKNKCENCQDFLKKNNEERKKLLLD